MISLVMISVSSIGDKAVLLLQYERSRVLQGELWRIFTSHLTHTSLNHLLLNLFGLLFIFLIWGSRLSPLKWMVSIACCMLGISIGHLLFFPHLDWYRGFSGVLHGMIVIGLISEIKRGNKFYLIGLIAVITKLLVEQVFGPLEPTNHFIKTPIITSAHLCGAITGVIVTYIFQNKKIQLLVSKLFLWCSFVSASKNKL